MNQRELSELRRRFRPDRSAVSHVYGCYVNGGGEIVSRIDVPLGLTPQDETEKYLAIFRRTLSGRLGKNLLDIGFSTRQVADSDEHRLLSSLRQSRLADEAARESFYQKAIAALDMEGTGYLLLLTHDIYDVPHRGADGETQNDASDRVFSYIVCAVCPVTDGRTQLGYCPGENEFRSRDVGQIVAPPELGFLFPAFDGRAANIYNALYYSRRPESIHGEFIGAVFRTEPPVTAPAQREAFQSALSESLAEECSMELVQSIHGQLLDRIEQHRESRDPEPLALSPVEIGGMLQDCGVSENGAQAFCKNCGRQLGGALLSPDNLIDPRRLEFRTAGITLTVDAGYSFLVESRVIDGRKYILIPADSGVELDGLPVSIAGGETSPADPSGGGI